MLGNDAVVVSSNIQPVGAVLSDDYKKDRADTYKALFELFKHLTTLSSGSILLILALAEKFIKQPTDSQLLLRAVFCLCVAMVTSVIAMGVLAFHAAGDSPSKGTLKLMAWAAFMSGVGFCGGLILVASAVLHAFG